jgi:hypothetical protein
LPLTAEGGGKGAKNHPNADHWGDFLFLKQGRHFRRAGPHPGRRQGREPEPAEPTFFVKKVYFLARCPIKQKNTAKALKYGPLCGILFL